MKQKVLFLVHRIPYPPNKGDKIRSFHFLKALNEHYHVYLGTFVDDPNDERYIDKLKQYCSEVNCLPLNPVLAKIKSLFGFLTGTALSLPYYHSFAMQRWVNQIIAQHDIRRIVVFSSVMAQFVLKQVHRNVIVDFVDVDSDKWRQYAENKTFPENWIYRRESKTLLTFEMKAAKIARQNLFVSEQEAELFRQLAPAVANKVTAIHNGVDIDYFNPELAFESPYAENSLNLVFTGAMDYWANVDAVVWFAEQVFPKVLSQYPNARFYIVGSKPTKAVQVLAERPGVVVTGRVEDVRPFLAHAAFAVAPLRIARGIQNKVLEAMAMEKMVIVTSAGLEGIAPTEQQDLIVCDESEQFAAQCCRLLQLSSAESRSKRNRAFIKTAFSWAASTAQLIQFIR